MSGVVGYSLKGINAEFSKGATARIFEPVLSARVAQGEWEHLPASEEEKTEIVQWWYSHLAQRQEKEVEKRMRGKGKGKERASGEDLEIIAENMADRERERERVLVMLK